MADMADSDSAEGSCSKVDPYGFERPDDFDYKSYEEFLASYLSVLARRKSRWTEYLDGKSSLNRSNTLKRFCRKGVPSDQRASIWMAVSGAEERQAQQPGLFRKLLSEPHDPQLVEVINTDLDRTFPDNIYFQNIPSDPNALRPPLFRVLVAVGHKNTRIGYCQGLNFITGLLLLIVKEEEQVFWLMDTLLNNIIPDYYTKDMFGIKVDQLVLGELVRMKDPEIHSFLEKHGAAWSLISTKWFICLFADVMPVETVLRIWDSLFYEGNKILFRVSVTLIKRNRAKILACKNFPEIMKLFKDITSNDPVVINCHDFMTSIFKEPGSFPRAMIEKLRKQCAAKVREEGF